MAERVVIIGSGPAGWSAAIYAARANLNPLLFEGTPHPEMIPLRQLAFTSEVENYAGFPAGNIRAFVESAVDADRHYNLPPAPSGHEKDGQPHYAVSIGLERDGELLTGVVFDVDKNEIFWAETGRGAWLDQRKLRVAARRHLNEAVIATGTPWHGIPGETHANFAREIAAMTPATAGIRRYGSAALDLAWVAAGRFDGFWERGLKPWDIAAGIVLVREAGGMATETNDGNLLETGDILAGNPDLHPLLLRQIRMANGAKA